MQVKIFQKFFPPFSSIRGTLIKGESLVSSIRSCRKSQFELHGARAGAPAFKPRPFPLLPPPPHPKRIENGRDDKTLAAHHEKYYSRHDIIENISGEQLRRLLRYEAVVLVTRFGYQFVFFPVFFLNHVVRLGIAEVFFFFFNYLIVTLICFFFFLLSCPSESKTESSSSRWSKTIVISRCFSSK